MLRSRLALSCVLPFALVACGGEEVAPAAVTTAEPADTLPVPGQSGGPVTGMPDAPGPGDVPLGGMPPAPPPGFDGLSGAPVMEIQVLEPLEDNPEAGFGSDPFAGEVAVVSAAGASAGGDGGAAAGAQDAVAAVRAYYDAVAAGDYRRAYAAWSDGGRGSGRTPEQFAAGFEGSRTIAVSPGEPGPIEGAAGSRYVEVPVTVTTRNADGREIQQVGSFVMRSSQVEGAAPGWHIASAELRELRP